MVADSRHCDALPEIWRNHYLHNRSPVWTIGCGFHSARCDCASLLCSPLNM